MREQEQVTEKGYLNKKLLCCYGVISAVLFLAYLIEYIKGNRTLGYTALFCLILLIPLFTTIFLYRRYRECEWIRKVAAYGYGILYAFVLWTTVTDLAFTYCVPMIMILAIYQDKKFALRVGITYTLINVVYIMIRCMKGKVASEDIVVFEIQIIVMLLVVSFSYVASNVLGNIAAQKMKLIEEEKEKVSEMLQNTISVTKYLCDHIINIDEEAKKMAQQGENSKLAVAQMVSGTEELAETTQRQFQMTENISELTKAAGDMMMQIKERFGITMKITYEGNDNMERLEVASAESKEVGGRVSEAMNELTEKTKEAKEILSLIDSITSETALLALNASIEAARAGEAGAGFAVVAEQIKHLAEETQNATEHISNIVGSLEEQADKAENSVESLLSTNESQIQLVEETKQSFHRIKNEMSHVSDEIDKEYDYMEKVTTSNAEINKQTEGLGAFSEELLANTENTQELSDQTIQGTERISELLDCVMAEVKKLQGMSYSQE